jgi:2-polyprenyl-6-methoxyphenol hydroxylase-like FAD-dependent oxidoreductase
METKKVLVRGAGIAGPTFAYWLTRGGFTPTLLERASALRTSGYVIDFWGLGYDIAEKMRLLPDILREGYHVQEVRIVESVGIELPASALRCLMTLPEADLSR